MSDALVVGGGGYLGSHLLAAAAQMGVAAAGWNSSKEDPEEWLRRVASGEFPVVINAAARTYRRPEERHFADYWDANVRLPARLAQAAISGQSRLLHVGTRWSLGELGEGPNSLYGATKLLGDTLAARCRQKGGSSRYGVVRVIRVRDLIGPADPRPNIVNALSDAFYTGRTLPMTAGHQLIDPLDVRDVARAIWDASLLPDALVPAFTEIGCEPISVRDFVHHWSQATGLHPAVNWGELPDRGTELYRMKLVHTQLPTFVPRSREMTYIDSVRNVFQG